MASNGEESKHIERIERAQKDVAKAMMQHQRGGKLDDVNRANRALADARELHREWSAGRVPDDR